MILFQKISDDEKSGHTMDRKTAVKLIQQLVEEKQLRIIKKSIKMNNGSESLVWFNLHMFMCYQPDTFLPHLLGLHQAHLGHMAKTP